MTVCPNCGSQQPDGAAFCDECGAALSGPGVGGFGIPAAAAPAGIPTVMASLCPVCGAQVSPGEQFCNSCGAAIGGQPAAPGLPAMPGSGLPTVGASQSGGRTCANCGAALEPDSAFCDMCGAPVQAAPPSYGPGAPQMPPVFQQPASPGDYGPTVIGQVGSVAPVDVMPGVPGVPQAAIQPPGFTPPPALSRGKLVVVGSNVSLPFPPGKTEIIIGREDPVSGVFPDIDLTDHGGDEGGVSRQHARIMVQGDRYFIEDLNSTNFTYLGQQKLAPRQPQALESGDELRLGRVKLVFQA